MYLDHFGFKREPFNITPDSRFLYASARHKEAMAALLYGIEQRKGFIALTGEIGSGKTTICRVLLKELDRDNIRLALVLNPQLNDLELLQAINAEYGIPHDSTSKRELLDTLNRFLLQQFEAGHNCVLVIDESQRLSFEALEQVRLISNLELEDTKLIQIALVGQPELDDMLHLPQLEQLNQRIMVRAHIDPLGFDEMAEYIAHRIAVAEPEKPARFHKKALRAIFDYSGGVPRKVNVVCDRALLVAFVSGAFEVSGEHARTAIEEVRGRRPGRKRPHTIESETPAPAESAEDRAEPELQRGGAGMLVPALLVLAVLVIAGVSLWKSGPGSADTPRTVAQATPTPMPTTTPAPSPSPAPTPTPTPAPTVPSPPPTPTPTPIVATPTATPVPTATPAPTPAPVVAEATPVPTPAPAPEAEWSYDIHGVMRVRRADVAYPAAVLTWLALTREQRLDDADLAVLRALDPAEAAKQRLATGAPPLFLVEATAPPALDVLRPAMLPALLQMDRDAPTVAPWTVLLRRADASGRAVLADPVRGIVQVAEEELENHLAGILIPYSDAGSVTGLKPRDQGERVVALQRALHMVGVYFDEPTGVFDRQTEEAVQQLRREHDLPGANTIDPLLATLLLAESR